MDGTAPGGAAAPERNEGGLLRIAVDRPVTVVVLALMVVLFGGLSVADLPIQLTPDISVPTLTVRTQWPGASPTEIETEIIEPQEDAVKDVTGLVEMTSEAQPDQATLTLEFEVGTDIDQALVRVSNALSEVGNYPEAAQEPALQTADSTGPPLAVIAVRSESGEPVEAYRTWIEDRIVPEIQRIGGVGDIRLRGGRDRILQIDFDPSELAARGIRIVDLAARVRSELRDVSGGDVTLGRRRLLVRTMAVEPTPARLDEIVIGAGPDGTPIRIEDVGRASEALREATGVAMSDDRPSIVLLLSREAGSNVLEVTRQIRAAVERLDREQFQPEGLRLELVSDQIDYIERALELVRQNLLLGAGLAVVVLFVFLRSVGASAIVSVAIPVCGFGTVLGMTLMGRSINVVSLAGITFAIGMVLDNSIVSLEAIDSWRHRVADPKRAALLGVREVWGAVLASTATTAAVFVPVMGWQGEVGQLLQDVAVAISFAVATSLLVSIWVIPSLAARLPPGKGAPRRSLLGALTRGIGSITTRLCSHAALGALIVIGAVGTCVLAAWTWLPALEYLPPGNRNLVAGILTPPPGTSVEELDAVAQKNQKAMAAHTGASIDGVPALERSFFVGGPDQLFAGAVAQDPERAAELTPWLRQVHGALPGFMAFTTQPSIFGRLGGGRSIELDLVGRDLGELTQTGGLMLGRIREIMPGAQVRPRPNLDPGALELRVHPKRRDAAGMGMRTDELGLVVDALVDGAIVGELGPEGESQVDVVLRAQRRDGALLEDPSVVASAPVVTPTGQAVPLAVLADLREELGPTVIRRRERRRAITLEVAPPESLPLESAIEQVRSDVLEHMRAEGTLPAGVAVEVTGTAGDLELAVGEFVEVLLIALVISYLLMSALFEDFIAPIVVMVTVPMAAAGGVAGLRLVDATLGAQSLDLVTAVGFLILIGVVVNNAILVVDGARTRLREGDELQAAVRASVQGRVRPILMTTATSLAGLLPMVVFPGSGSELYRGVGAIVLGGLALSTILTLFVVPAFFSLIWRLRVTLGGGLR